MIRPPLSLIAAALAVLLGMAGLVRGSIPQSAAASSPASQTAPIVIGGAYVREPANDVNAAAYFTVFNTTDSADVLTSVTTGAGAVAGLHTDTADGAMVAMADGLTIPAHSSVRLSPGKGHVMIEKLYGPLKPGQTVNMRLDFAKAGQLLVTAPVIAIAAPAPTAVAPK